VVPSSVDDGITGSGIGTIAASTDVVLVRHAMPETDPTVAPERWPLGEASRDAARRLARLLPAEPLVLVSDETRATQTANELVAVRGGFVRVDARIGEAHRPDRWHDDYRARGFRYVAGQTYVGWEPHETVVRRFDAGVRAALGVRADAPLVIVSHGLALTLWLQSVGAVSDVGAFWQDLTFPDAFRVSVQTHGNGLLATATTRLGH
jgi:broad specificity phosphatase PhoE